MLKKKKEKNELLSSALAAYLILLLHIPLVAGVGLLVLFFSGVYQYMFWIFLGCAAAAGVFGYFIYRRLSSPLSGGRTVEVSVLGGIASFRLGKPEHFPVPDPKTLLPQARQLQLPASDQAHDLAELGRLLEKELITPDEFRKAKDSILKT